MLSTLGNALISSTQGGCHGTLLPALQIAQRSVLGNFYASKAKATPPYLAEAKPKKKENKIPRAIGAYAYFVKEQAAARKGTGKAPEVLKVLAQEWKSLSDSQKQPYQQLADKSKAEAAAARAEAKAARAPPAAYAQYCREVCLELATSAPQLTATERIQQAAARWRAMSDAEKDQRKAVAKQARDAWKLQNPTK